MSLWFNKTYAGVIVTFLYFIQRHLWLKNRNFIFFFKANILSLQYKFMLNCLRRLDARGVYHFHSDHLFFCGHICASLVHTSGVDSFCRCRVTLYDLQYFTSSSIFVSYWRIIVAIDLNIFTNEEVRNGTIDQWEAWKQ